VKLTPTPKFSYVTSLAYREAGLVAHTVRGPSFGKGGPRGVSGEGIEKTTIIEFVPLLVFRFTRERSRAVGQVEGKLTRDIPEVLFVCAHNAGRSQIAAALTHALSEGRVHVRSAGSTPASEINPAVIEAMSEIGLDLSQEFPKPLTDEVVEAADVVVTMGCGDACPIYPGKKYEDWQIADPAGAPVDKVRAIRGEIRGRVEQLLRGLDIPIKEIARSS